MLIRFRNPPPHLVFHASPPCPYFNPPHSERTPIPPNPRAPPAPGPCTALAQACARRFHAAGARTRVGKLLSCAAARLLWSLPPCLLTDHCAHLVEYGVAGITHAPFPITAPAAGAIGRRTSSNPTPSSGAADPRNIYIQSWRIPAQPTHHPRLLQHDRPDTH
jgi:hypothetical protein